MPAIKNTRSRPSISRNPLPALRPVMSKANTVQLFDVGANRPSGDKHKPETAILLTGEEVNAQGKAQREFLGMCCTDCKHPIAIWGFGAYHEDEEVPGKLVPTFPVCKGCFVYSLTNPGANWVDDAPAVRSLAFQTVWITDGHAPPAVYVPPWVFGVPNEAHRLPSS